MVKKRRVRAWVRTLGENIGEEPHLSGMIL